jgi:hypothetical protein
MTAPPKFDKLDDDVSKAYARGWENGAEWMMARYRAQHEAGMRELRALQDECRAVLAEAQRTVRHEIGRAFDAGRAAATERDPQTPVQ